jgi:glutaredoxin-like protein NrdH
MMVEPEVVEGEDKGKVMLYALSTCVWCKKTKKLLEDFDVKYSFIFVDKLDGKEREKVVSELKKYNKRGSFPTIVIDDDKVIVGFKEDEIKENLES